MRLGRSAWMLAAALGTAPACRDDGDTGSVSGSGSGSGSATDPLASTGEDPTEDPTADPTAGSAGTGTTALATSDTGAGSGGLLTTGDGSTSGVVDDTGGVGGCEACEPGSGMHGVCVRGSECSGDSCTSMNACLPDPGTAVVNCATAGDAFCGTFGPDYACYDEPTGPYCCAGDPRLCTSAG